MQPSNDNVTWINFKQPDPQESWNRWMNARLNDEWYSDESAENVLASMAGRHIPSFGDKRVHDMTREEQLIDIMHDMADSMKVYADRILDLMEKR